MHNNWFAIRTKSNRESAISEALAGKGYEVIFPRYKASSIHNTNVRRKSSSTALKPLFPGYLFCKFDVLDRLPILTIPGVMNVVSNGRIPIPLDDEEIESLRVLVNSSLSLGPYPYLKVGDRVMISQGPLTGASGCIVQTDKRRLIVSITLLQRSVAVDVASEWLEKCEERNVRLPEGDPARLVTRLSDGLQYPARDAFAGRFQRTAVHRNTDWVR